MGTTLLVAIMWRIHRRRLTIWVVALVGILAFTAASVRAVYDSPAKIASYGAAVVSRSLVAINGRVEGIDTLGGIVQDEFGFIASFLMPLLGMSWVASLTRAEEEEGRLEMLAAGRIDRRSPVVAALVLVLAAVVVVTLGSVITLVAAGIGLGPATLYAVSEGLVTLVFAALSAVSAQAVVRSRGIYLLGLLALGISLVLRGVGDVTRTFWAWLSPLGWQERAAPFGPDPRWWALAIPVVVSTALWVLAMELAGRRDLGSALLRRGRGRGAAADRLVDPLGLGLAVRRLRGPWVAWLVGTLTLAAVMGALSAEMARAVAGSPALGRAMGMAGGDAVGGVLAVTQVYLALVTCGYAVHAIATLRQEEAAGHLEPMLVGTVGRARWLAGQLLVVGAGSVLLVVLGDLVCGVSASLSTGRAAYVGRLLLAGPAYLPAEMVLAALAALLFGLLPRVSSAGWVAFGAVTLVELLGPGLRLPRWVLDLSPLSEVGTPPGGVVHRAALIWLVVVSAVLLVAAFAAFRRRGVPAG